MCVRDLVVVQLQSHAVVNLVVCQRDVILQAVINGGLYLCFMSARSGTGCPSQLSLTREKIGTSQVAGSKQARQYLVDIVPLLNANLLWTRAGLGCHQLLQVPNGIVLAVFVDSEISAKSTKRGSQV